MVLRYAYFLHQQIIKLQIDYSNNTVSFPLIDEDITLSNMTRLFQRNDSALFVEAINYTIKISTNSTTTFQLDSILIIPDYKSTNIYKQSNGVEKQKILSCWKDSQLIQSQMQSKYCERLVFSSTSELFDGNLGISLLIKITKTKLSWSCYSLIVRMWYLCVIPLWFCTLLFVLFLIFYTTFMYIYLVHRFCNFVPCIVLL